MFLSSSDKSNEEPMNWSDATAILKEIKVPAGYEISQMSRDDVVPSIAALRRWYPEIGVGAESCHLDVDFYARHGAFAGMSDDRPLLPIVAKHGTSVVAMITLEKNVLARNIMCRLGALDPDHRGGLAILGPILLERIGRAIGAEMAYYFAPL